MKLLNEYEDFQPTPTTPVEVAKALGTFRELVEQNCEFPVLFYQNGTYVKQNGYTHRAYCAVVNSTSEITAELLRVLPFNQRVCFVSLANAEIGEGNGQVYVGDGGYEAYHPQIR